MDVREGQYSRNGLSLWVLALLIEEWEGDLGVDDGFDKGIYAAVFVVFLVFRMFW